MKQTKIDINYLFAGIIISFFAVYNFLLIVLNKTPPMHDESWYLSTSVGFYNNLERLDVRRFLHDYSHSFLGMKAPLIALMPMPFYFVFGLSYKSAMLVNISMVVLLSWLCFKFVEYINKDKLAALFSVIIINTMPLYYMNIRVFMVEYSLSFLVMLGIFYLLKSDYFRSDNYVDKLGLVFGFGLLMKILYPLFLLGPVIAVLFAMLKRKISIMERQMAKRILRFCFIALTVACSWYFFNLRIFKYAFSFGYGKIASSAGIGPVFSLTAIINYLSMLIGDGVSWYYFSIALLCCLIAIKKRMFGSSVFLRNNAAICLWFLLPLVIMVFSVNRQIRYMLPALAPLAIFLGIGISRIFKRYGFLFLAFPLVIFISSPILRMPVFVTKLFNPAGIDMNSDWKIRELVEAIPAKNKHIQYILCATDHKYYNAFTLQYYAALKNLPYVFISATEGKNWNQVRDMADRAGLILIKSSDTGASFFNNFNSELRDFILKKGQSFKEAVRYVLPDNSTVSVYSRL